MCSAFSNPVECELVVELCRMLKKEISEDNFGVITPYRGQVDLTRKRLQQK